jgi:hypothetical protein
MHIDLHVCAALSAHYILHAAHFIYSTLHKVIVYNTQLETARLGATAVHMEEQL